MNETGTRSPPSLLSSYPRREPSRAPQLPLATDSYVVEMIQELVTTCQS